MHVTADAKDVDVRRWEWYTHLSPFTLGLLPQTHPSHHSKTFSFLDCVRQSPVSNHPCFRTVEHKLCDSAELLSLPDVKYDSIWNSYKEVTCDPCRHFLAYGKPSISACYYSDCQSLWMAISITRFSSYVYIPDPSPQQLSIITPLRMVMVIMPGETDHWLYAKR